MVVQGWLQGLVADPTTPTTPTSHGGAAPSIDAMIEAVADEMAAVAGGAEVSVFVNNAHPLMAQGWWPRVTRRGFAVRTHVTLCSGWGCVWRRPHQAIPTHRLGTRLQDSN